MAGEEEQIYQPKDALKAASQGFMIFGGVGFLFSAVQSTLSKQNVGTLAVFTKFSGTWASFAAVGTTYSFVKTASANLREKEDAYNTALAGFLGGSFLGLRSGTLQSVIGYGALAAGVMGVFDATGGRLTGYKTPSDMDEFEKKQYLRANRRRPIQQTIDELGEGRGIKAPGWQERRAARIKEAYGIDVPK